MPRTTWLLLSLLVALLPGAACADPSADLEGRLRAYLAARDPRTRRQHLDAVLALEPDVREVAALLPRCWTWPEDGPVGQVLTWERETPDGTPHTVFAYVPATYDPSTPWPTLLYLHGDVMREEDGGGQEAIELLVEEAEARGFLLLAPSTRDGAPWWSADGRGLALGALRDLKRRYHVDADHVAVLGRSDGGSACYHLLAHAPDPFCCFVACVGNPRVTEVHGGPTWPGNLASRPIYALSGAKDPVYPSRAVEPHVLALEQAGCRITWVEDADADHDVASFFARRWPEMHVFWQAHRREAAPAEVTWTTSSAQGARRAWVEIVRLDPETATVEAAAAPDVEVARQDAARGAWGLRLEATDDGVGLRVVDVEDGTPAEAGGLLAGDVLLRVGDTELVGSDASEVLRRALDQARSEGVTFAGRRGNEPLALRVRPRPAPAPPVAAEDARGYGIPPGTVTARVAGGNRLDVATDGVAALRLHLLADLVDLDRDLSVVLDGRVVFSGPAPCRLDHLLAEAWRQGPGAPVVVGYLDLEPGPAAAGPPADR